MVGPVLDDGEGAGQGLVGLDAGVEDVHHRGDGDVPEAVGGGSRVGVRLRMQLSRFRTWSEASPQPTPPPDLSPRMDLGSAVEPLVTLEGRVTDARDGTPIVDLKPYIPKGDAIPEAAAPEWVKRPRPPE